jgi:hypothetical protein
MSVDVREMEFRLFARAVRDMRSFQKNPLVPLMHKQKKQKAAVEQGVDRYIAAFFAKEGSMDVFFQSLRGFNGVDLLIANAVIFGLYYLFRKGKRHE